MDVGCSAGISTRYLKKAFPGAKEVSSCGCSLCVILSWWIGFHGRDSHYRPLSINAPTYLSNTDNNTASAAPSQVTGLDLSPHFLAVARLREQEAPLGVQYRHAKVPCRAVSVRFVSCGGDGTEARAPLLRATTSHNTTHPLSNKPKHSRSPPSPRPTNTTRITQRHPTDKTTNHRRRRRASPTPHTT